ncbi:MAG TPA: hypothetical protein VGO89_18095 [Streptomyces sp.]|nr:hypothetical protein [Streptomyces sp.]
MSAGPAHVVPQDPVVRTAVSKIFRVALVRGGGRNERRGTRAQNPTAPSVTPVAPGGTSSGASHLTSDI